jgi:hypothetical protein
MKARVMPQLREVEETQVIDHWAIREEQEALLFFRDIEDRIWFHSNPGRELRVRPAEPVEVATLTSFERAKLRRDAPLREQASGKAVVPEMMIVIKMGEGRVPYRPLPILPHIEVIDSDVGAATYLLVFGMTSAADFSSVMSEKSLWRAI